MNRRTIAGGCALLLLLVTAILSAQTKKPPVKTGKIYVGSFGMGDDGEQLKLALGYELSRAGFKVVDFEPQCDTTISGLIVTRMEGGRSVKRVTVFLKDRAGRQIWNEDIGSTSNATKSAQEGIRLRAQDIARALKQDAAPPAVSKTAKPKA